MIKYALLLVTLTVLVPRDASADGRINLRVDFNRTNVAGAYNTVDLGWQGFEVELDNEFAKNKIILSGFSVGLRRELFYGFTGFGTTGGVHKWDEGTYLTLRLYRTFDVSGRKWSIGPSFAILYGIPGTTLDRTTGQSAGLAASDYTHIFPIRNNDLPKVLIERANLATDSALLYPEASLSIRRRLARGGIALEWVAGVRAIRFGIVDSNSQGDRFSEKRVLIPSVAMGVGFRIF